MNPESTKNLKVQYLREGFSLRNTRRILNNPVAFLGDLAKNYGPVVRMNIAGRKYSILQEPDLIKHVLSDHHKNYSKFGITKILRVFFGEGLVTSNGAQWIKKRRIIQPAFHKKRINHILDIINEETTNFIQTLKDVPSGSQINMSEEMLKLNVAIVNKALFSTNDDKEMQSMILILKNLTDFATNWMKSIIKIPLNWPSASNIEFHKNCKEYDDIIYGMIQKRRIYREKHQEHPYNDLLDMLFNDVPSNSDSQSVNKQLRDDITTMFMAGHDTTAQTLTWILYEISKNKEINDKIHQEVSTLLTEESLSLEDLSKVEYINKVIKEGMRCYPSISAIQRRPIKKDEFKGIKIKKSARLLINIYGMHHHPKYWNQPQEFNPERFTEKAESLRQPFVYLPFGGGPRRCIGSNFATMVMQVVLGQLFKYFTFEVPKGYRPIIIPNITIKPKEGIPLIVYIR